MAKLTFGSCYFSTPAETILTANTPAKAAGATTAMLLAGFTHSDNRITNSGDGRTYAVRFDGSVSKEDNQSTVARARIHVNGSPLAGGSIRTIDGSDLWAFSFSGLAFLDTWHYVELWLETNTGDNLTVGSGTLAALVIGS